MLSEMQPARRIAQSLNNEAISHDRKVMLLFTEHTGQVRVLTGTASSSRVGADPGLFGHTCTGKVFPLQLYCCMTAKKIAHGDNVVQRDLVLLLRGVTAAQISLQLCIGSLSKNNFCSSPRLLAELP